MPPPRSKRRGGSAPPAGGSSKRRAPARAPPVPRGRKGADDEGLSDEDIAFLSKNANRLGFLSGGARLEGSSASKERGTKGEKKSPWRGEGPGVTPGGEEDGYGSEASSSELSLSSADSSEEEYERRPRGLDNGAGAKKPAPALPVKTTSGALVKRAGHATGLAGGSSDDDDDGDGSSGAAVTPASLGAPASSLVAGPGVSIPGITIRDELAEALVSGEAAARAAREEERRRRREAERAAAEAEREEAAARTRAGRERGGAGEGTVGGAEAGGLLRALAEGRADAGADPTARRGRSALGPLAARAARLAAAKDELASAASRVLAQPEKNLALLGQIAEAASQLAGPAEGEDAGATVDPAVARLAALSCAALFADLLPAYRIKSIDESGTVLSKDVAALREYEAGLLRVYQGYLRGLHRAVAGGARPAAARGPGGASGRVGASRPAAGGAGPASTLAAKTAIRCMARLLTAAPHFNYGADLVQSLVPASASRHADVSEAACEALSSLLSSDDAEERAPQVVTGCVQLLADLVRRRDCDVPVSVGAVLLQTRFGDLRSAADVAEGARYRRAKGGRKARRARDDVDRAFKEAEARADLDARRASQSARLEALFEVFFRVLKHATAAQGLREPDALPMADGRFRARFRLLDPTLEGLGRYAHLISVEYFGDLLDELQRLLEAGGLPIRARLRALLTATSVLRGQGEALPVDRRTFFLRVYDAIERASLSWLEEPEADEGEDGARGPASAAASLAADPADLAAASYDQPPVVLLLEILEPVLIEWKALDASRAAAFAKRLAAAAAHSSDPGAACGTIALLARALRRVPRLRGALEHEGLGPASRARYDPAAEDPANAAALDAPLWELSALAASPHPHVAAAAAALAAGDLALAGVFPAAASPAQVASAYSAASGGSFKPAPQAPSRKAGRGMGRSFDPSPYAADDATVLRIAAGAAAEPLSSPGGWARGAAAGAPVRGGGAAFPAGTAAGQGGKVKARGALAAPAAAEVAPSPIWSEPAAPPPSELARLFRARRLAALEARATVLSGRLARIRELEVSFRDPPTKKTRASKERKRAKGAEKGEGKKAKEGAGKRSRGEEAADAGLGAGKERRRKAGRKHAV